MRTFRILLALWFALISSHSLPVLAASVKAEKSEEKILLDMANFFNSLKSVGHMVNLMKASASEDDKEFLNDLDKETLAQPIPNVTVDVRKKIVYFKGLKPLQVLDLNKGKFSIDEREFSFDSTLNAEKAIAELENLFFPQKSAWLNWILPQAHAVSKQQKGMLMGVFGAMGIMGMMACFSGQKPAQQGQQQQQQQQQNQGQQQMSAAGGCGMGIAALLGLFLAMGIKTDEAKEVKCTVTMNGVQTAQVVGPGGRVLSSTQGLPGQYVNYPPSTGPMNYGNQLMQICSNPTALGNINQALAAPIVLPPAKQMKAYATGGPARPVTTTTQSLAPQSRDPAQSGNARFLEPGTGGAR